MQGRPPSLKRGEWLKASSRIPVMVIADLNKDNKRIRRAVELQRRSRASWGNVALNYGTAATGLQSRSAAGAALSAIGTFRTEMEKSRSERLFRPKTVHAARHRHVVLPELEAQEELARSAKMLVPKITDDAYLRVSSKAFRAKSSSSSRPSTSSQSPNPSLMRASSAPHLARDLSPLRELLKLRDAVDRRAGTPAESAKPRRAPAHVAQPPPGAENGSDADADAALYRDLLKLRDAVLERSGTPATASSVPPHSSKAFRVAVDDGKQQRHRHRVAKDKSPAAVYLGAADELKLAGSRPSALAAGREARLHTEAVSEVHKRLLDDLDWLSKAVRRELNKE